MTAQPYVARPADEPGAKLDLDERQAVLSTEIAQWVGRGYRVESQSEIQAVLVKGKPTNHVLHLLLSVFTLGLWLIVWLIVGGQTFRRLVLNVARDGEITANPG